MAPSVTPSEAAWFSKRLLSWFAANQRQLPWRSDRTPYRVWIAEMMLQQTRVATAGPYFERFVARFPDLTSLADASSDEVLKHWEGLGYYRRAHHVRAAAALLVAEGLRELPNDFDRISALPGVGRYTAGAVASLAFNQPKPVVDGNVRRVLCRFFAKAGDPTAPAVQRWLWSAAEALLPQGRAGAFNEALMELGATLCTPRAPDCPRCPVRTRCRARADGRVEAFPEKKAARSTPHLDVVAGIIWRGGRLLVTRRRDEAMLGGLWEFPGGKVEAGESLEQALHRELDEELGIRVRIEAPFVKVDHAYSHFRITLHTFTCRHLAGRPRTLGCSALRWVPPSALGELAFPKADRVVLEALNEQRTAGSKGVARKPSKRPSKKRPADERAGKARSVRPSRGEGRGKPAPPK